MLVKHLLITKNVIYRQLTFIPLNFSWDLEIIDIYLTTIQLTFTAKYFTKKNYFKQHKCYQMETPYMIKTSFCNWNAFLSELDGMIRALKTKLFINFVLISINCYTINKNFDFDQTYDGQTWLMHKIWQEISYIFTADK